MACSQFFGHINLNCVMVYTVCLALTWECASQFYRRPYISAFSDKMFIVFRAMSATSIRNQPLHRHSFPMNNLARLYWRMVLNCASCLSASEVFHGLKAIQCHLNPDQGSLKYGQVRPVHKAGHCKCANAHALMAFF